MRGLQDLGQQGPIKLEWCAMDELHKRPSKMGYEVRMSKGASSPPVPVSMDPRQTRVIGDAVANAFATPVGIDLTKPPSTSSSPFFQSKDAVTL